MKKVFIVAVFLQLCLGISAQQEAQYTQFMFNKLALNPAYAGSTEVACVSCLHRSQWVGLEGAPVSQLLNFQIPIFSDRVGLGASVSHDVIGPTNSWKLSTMYSYRLPVSNGTLAIGLQGSLRNYQIKWSETSATHSGDQLIPGAESTKVIPNFGAGLYYNTSKYYVGLSVPSLIRSDLNFNDATYSNTDYGREESHGYLMAGVLFDLSNSIKLKPAILMKYASNTPFDMDLNLSFIFFEKLWLGATYRLGGNSKESGGFGESLDFVLQYQLAKALKAGVAYDVTLSKLKDYNSGTFEVMLEYCINRNDQRLTNPRFF